MIQHTFDDNFDDILMTIWCTFDWWTLCSSTADPLTTFWRHFWWPFNMEMTYLHGISWWKHEQLLMTFTILDENMTLLLMTFLTTKRGLIGMIQCKTQHTFDDILMILLMTLWWFFDDDCLLVCTVLRFLHNFWWHFSDDFWCFGDILTFAKRNSFNI